MFKGRYATNEKNFIDKSLQSVVQYETGKSFK